MNIFSVISIIELLVLVIVLLCIILLIKLVINRKYKNNMNKMKKELDLNLKKMNKLDAELSHIRNFNNLVNDEKYLEMTLPFNPLI